MKETWSQPVIEDLGDAKDKIEGISVAGSGDANYSILLLLKILQAS